IYSAELKRMAFPNLTAGRMWHSEEERKQEEAKDTAVIKPVDIDTLITSLPTNVRENIFNQASSLAQQQVSELQFKSLTVHDDKRIMRRHEIELLKKFTLSVACLVFFFIGAPLGAIIRKGGLGTPLVISVLLFLFYYIIDNTGYKMARDGRWVVWCGIWLSTFILAPLGIYVTYKAMNDSSVFDADRYKALFSKLIGRKVDRKVNYKEVIINDISTSEAIARLSALREMALAFVERYSKRQSYMTYWKQGYDSASILQISETLEEDVDYMTDCRNQLAVNKLMDYPVIRNLWVYHPGQVKWLGTAGLWVIIVGFPVYLLGLKAQKNLKEEMRRIATVSTAILDILEPHEN
ncbi:MAG: LptF/LptG family permease, partial [Muribaculaceae bacterium]|nr:LptF/LptG family permease [Muribaculaceae bacterium]